MTSQWDIITGDIDYNVQSVSFFTIGDLIDVCNQYPNNVVYFVGTQQSPGELGSWRGSYDLPAIEPIWEDRTGAEVAKQLEKGLTELHYGYKGGEYKYYPNEEFYVSPYGSAREHKVVMAQLGEYLGDTVLILYTKLDPY